MLFQQSVNKIKIIKICIYLIVLALIFKVGYIQIIDRKNIYDKALESWQRSFPVQANRGKIYDRSGNVLATDLTTASLVVVPSQIKDQATTALELSKILNVDVNVLKEKLIEILETMGYPAYLQGSMSEYDEYPESFFTFWNFDTEEIRHY